MVELPDVEVERVVEHVDGIDGAGAEEAVVGLLARLSLGTLLQGLSLCDLALREPVLARFAVLYHQVSLLLQTAVGDNRPTLHDPPVPPPQALLHFPVQQSQLLGQTVIKHKQELQLAFCLFCGRQLERSRRGEKVVEVVEVGQPQVVDESVEFLLLRRKVVYESSHQQLEPLFVESDFHA